MVSIRGLLLAGLLATQTAFALPTSSENGPLVKRTTVRGDAIKEAFLHSWAGYKKYAWGSDELLSVSNTGGNSRNGWGASIADALTTAILMELDDVVMEQLEFLSTVDFTTTATEVSLFETTIRYLGGLISGYDLLKGPYAKRFANKERSADLIEALRDQAVVLADRLAFAFDTPSGVPYNNLNFATNSSGDTTNGVATTGTLVMEWVRLSDITGDPKYAAMAEKAESYLLDPKPALGEPYPGMLGTNINIKTGLFVDSSGGWSGGTDSFYEYLIKMWIYDSTRFSTYKDRWITAVESTIEYLLYNPTTAPATTFVSQYRNSQTLSLNQGHLTCFIGGNLMLGGQLLNRGDIKAAGIALTSGCHDTYTASTTGIGPEGWSFDPNNVPTNQAAFFAEHGYYTTAWYYDLRPEVIESYYHGWRLTGEEKYRDWAWTAFKAINVTCRTESGYTSVGNVSATDGGEKWDFQESFWFAEVLKYLYITFTSETEVGVRRGKNSWVFNTEAHPFKVAV
ncbi:glycoside hydrolase [Geopyxis carbonaria]|nr:glycoside hydrolase [Geopyxis carbonaria]